MQISMRKSIVSKLLLCLDNRILYIEENAQIKDTYNIMDKSWNTFLNKKEARYERINLVWVYLHKVPSQEK